MRKITKNSRANEVLAGWKRQYGEGTYWQEDEEKQDILDKLENLGVNPFPDDVDSVIGNDSWTRTKCDECNASNVDVIQIGQDPDYESSTAEICKDCLAKALDL